MVFTEYWLISAPADETRQETWEKMNKLTAVRKRLCENHKFHLPHLDFGTLNQLIGLIDDLT